MNEIEKIIDDSGDRKYFTMLQNFIFDLPLNVYAFRVYAHIKRVAGDNGVCWQSVRTIAERCNISPSSVTRAIRDLSKYNLIDVKRVSNDGDKYQHTEIRIRNIWPHNVRYFELSEDERKQQRQLWRNNHA